MFARIKLRVPSPLGGGGGGGGGEGGRGGGGWGGGGGGGVGSPSGKEVTGVKMRVRRRRGDF